MKKILLLDGFERMDKETIEQLAVADMVIDPVGNVLKVDGDGPSLINHAELVRVLTTRAKPRKTVDAAI